MPDLDCAKARQIIDGAKKTFLASGYAGTSMNEIVRRTGVSKGTLYAYFPTKEALFEAIIQEECELRSEQVPDVVAPGADVTETLTVLAENYIRLAVAPVSQDLFRVAVAEACRFPALAQTFYKSGPAKGGARLAKLLAGFAADGQLAIDDPVHAAMRFRQLCRTDAVNRVMFKVQKRVPRAEIKREADAAVGDFLKLYGV